jgi:hypothetical protein
MSKAPNNSSACSNFAIQGDDIAAAEGAVRGRQPHNFGSGRSKFRIDADGKLQRQSFDRSHQKFALVFLSAAA